MTRKTERLKALPKAPLAKKAPRRKRAPAAKISAMTSESDVIELFPSGISVSSQLGRPVLILKDKNSVEVLPVWMHPIDAGVALAELSQGSGATPHIVSRRVLEMMGLKLESCTFAELIGHHQFVTLAFISDTGVRHTMRVRADEAMSFSLQARARFFCSKALMARCRDLDGDLTQLETHLNEGQLPSLKTEIEISSKKSPYVM